MRGAHVVNPERLLGIPLAHKDIFVHP